jgi:hypothetical protein
LPNSQVTEPCGGVTSVLSLFAATPAVPGGGLHCQLGINPATPRLTRKPCRRVMPAGLK